MMRSLYSGVAGLRTHQTRMDVIGNNIANVNTVGFKSSSVTFADMLYQTTSTASGPNATTGTGGVNARQIGLGVKSGAISTAITTAGSAQTTNNPFDIMITGDSFFIVNDGTNNYFTRDGSFCVDAAGNLVMSSTGYNVMGWQVDATNPNAIKQDTVTALRIMSAENMTYPAEQTTKAYMSGIVDKNDTNVTGSGKIVNLKIYDSLGYSYTAKLTIKVTDADAGAYNISITGLLDENGVDLLADTTDENGATVAATVTATLDEKDMATGQSLYFNTTTGVCLGTTTTLDEDQGLTLAISGIDAFTEPIEIDISALTNFNNDGTSTASATAGDADGNNAGRKIGEMSGVTISNNGMIYATYDNGQRRLLGQIAAASFANAAGLSKEGDNLYAQTQNSGVFDGIGVDVTADGGYFTTGELEMSNVDLSAQLTDMIVTQRGFQANSRIITVSDSMLEELVNLKRS